MSNYRNIDDQVMGRNGPLAWAYDADDAILLADELNELEDERDAWKDRAERAEATLAKVREEVSGIANSFGRTQYDVRLRKCANRILRAFAGEAAR